MAKRTIKVMIKLDESNTINGNGRYLATSEIKIDNENGIVQINPKIEKSDLQFLINLSLINKMGAPKIIDVVLEW